MDIPKEKLKFIKESLRYGSLKRISEATGYSKQTVHNVLNGKHRNSKVVEACINELQAQKNIATELTTKIDQLGA